MSMYETMRTVILSHTLPVAELHRRVDVFYAEGKLTEAEKTELDQMIFDNQTPDAEKAALEQRFAELTKRLDALETRVTALDGGESGGGTDSTYPEWKPWDGVSIDYQPGAIVTHNGKTWKNVLDGMQNVWEPGTVDDRYWMEVS